MTFVSKKKIHGKERYYLEKSIRFPGGKVKKYSVYLKGYDPKRKHLQLRDREAVLEGKIAKELLDFAAKRYKKSPIFTGALIRQLEEMRLCYKNILKKLSEKQLQDVIDRFTVNFTYESNALEGNSLTLKDVSFVLQEGKVLHGKDLREVYEALNTRKAMQLIFDRKLKVHEKDIIRLHKILVKNTGVATGYKRFPNFLLNRQVETTPPERVKEEMGKLLEWYHAQDDLHPLQTAAIFHGMFERIHPFEDGNGRVGRLLINIMLLTKGFPPLIIRKTHRISYLNALEAFDSAHQDKLFRFLIEKYKDTYRKFFKIYIQYL